MLAGRDGDQVTGIGEMGNDEFNWRIYGERINWLGQSLIKWIGWSFARLLAWIYESTRVLHGLVQRSTKWPEMERERNRRKNGPRTGFDLKFTCSFVQRVLAWWMA